MQLYFDFADWERAFQTFYRLRRGSVIRDADGTVIGSRSGNPNLVLIVSTAPEVSGYWIEERGEQAKGDAHTRVYGTYGQARRLERRIRQARKNTANLSLGGVVM